MSCGKIAKENQIDKILQTIVWLGYRDQHSMLSCLPSEIIQIIASYLRSSDIKILSVFLHDMKIRNFSNLTLVYKRCPRSFDYGMVEINFNQETWNNPYSEELSGMEVKKLFKSYDLFRVKSSQEHGISHWSVKWSFPFTLQRVLVTKTSMSLLIEQEEFSRSISILRKM